jgi:GTPase SAR1 family protein
MEKTFELVDASGNERFLNGNKIFYKEADIVLLVYDITDKKSLRGVISIYNSLEYCLELKEHTVFVIANKIDLIDQQEDNE